MEKREVNFYDNSFLFILKISVLLINSWVYEKKSIFIMWWLILIDFKNWTMSNVKSSNANIQSPISTIEQEISRIVNQSTLTNRTERIKSCFTTNQGRIVLSELFFTSICVILQHVMGTCDHSVSDGSKVIKWYVFIPPCMLLKWLYNELFPIDIFQLTFSRSWSSYSHFLFCTLLDNFGLLYSTYMDVFNNKYEFIKKTRFNCQWYYCYSIFSCIKF